MLRMNKCEDIIIKFKKVEILVKYVIFSKGKVN